MHQHYICWTRFYINHACAGYTGRCRDNPRVGLERTNIKKSSKTLKDYEFLIGAPFRVDGELYTVQELKPTESELFVNAEHGGNVAVFTVEQVMNALLVDEEIELFSPNYLKSL